MAPRPTLYRAIACNFCQRAEIALSAKGVDVDLIEIDLVRRPSWFREKASGGSVPLFEWDALALHPSAVINEFIEERWPSPSMLPEDPAERATARMWIEWWNQEPCPAYERRLMNVRPERDAELSEVLEKSLRDCEGRLSEKGYEGGYWDGKQLGLVDATAAPMFVRFVGLQHFHGIDIPADCTRVRAWRDTLLADPHVSSTAPDEQELLETYARYREVLTKAAQAGIDVPVARGD